MQSTAASPQAFFPRFTTALLAALRHVPAALRRYPLLTAFLALYALGRFAINYWHFTAHLGTALLSALMGLLLNGLMVVLIDTLHVWRFGGLTDPCLTGTIWESGPNRKALIVLIVFWLLWLAVIVDHNQRAGSIPGAPVLGLLPGWAALNSLLAAVGGWLGGRLPVTRPGALSAYPAMLLVMALLVLALRLVGLRGRDFSLHFRNGWVALPLLAINGAVLALNGPTLPALTALGLGLLHPGLTEELFYRGLLQRALRGWLRPGSAILLGALFFALLHFPGYFFNLYGQDIWQTLLNMGDGMLTGLVWGYGFHRSGGLLPWVGVHALSNLAGL